MKKFILTALAFGLLPTTFAQNEQKKLPALGIHLFFNDFQTAAELRSSGLAGVLRTENWKETSRMTPGVAVSYIEGLSNHIDFIGVASGSFMNYPIPGKSGGSSSNFLMEVTAAANFKLTTDRYVVSPYFSVGVGASKYEGYFGAFIPAGIGLQVNLFDEAFLLINSQYRVPVTENVAYSLCHSIGLAGNIVNRKVVEPAQLPAPPLN